PARARENILRECDQLQIGIAACRVECDQPPQHVDDGIVRHHESIDETGLPMMGRNSRRVSGFLRNSPSIVDVTMVTPGLCTPRVVMHWCGDSITTATPLGSSTFLIQLAICAFNFSCT